MVGDRGGGQPSLLCIHSFRLLCVCDVVYLGITNNQFNVMAQFIVVGADETVENVDIRGVLRTPGEVVELEHEDAQPLVDAGFLKPHDGGDDLAKTDEVKSGDENTAGASDVATDAGAGEASVAEATDTTVEAGATAPTEQA